MPDSALQPQVDQYDRHVFVYGTLRRGELRDINGLFPAPVFIGFTTVRGILYDLGRYPGIRLGEPGCADPVYGEVYAITPAIEVQLDAIEEVSPDPNAEYVKRYVTVQPAGELAAGHETTSCLLNCLVYEVSADHFSGKPIISGGDWVTYRRKCKSE